MHSSFGRFTAVKQRHPQLFGTDSTERGRKNPKKLSGASGVLPKLKLPEAEPL
jgi:hypothetical protein